MFVADNSRSSRSKSRSNSLSSRLSLQLEVEQVCAMVMPSAGLWHTPPAILANELTQVLSG
ncbi:GM19357 [Drosophila sechellia]|uniref:GM19357 n=1 Tax=Drosophila sechellia TaxID=7238 RepID=B4HUW1_DROSE|nr:GM19357 [Drosophila sechellia]